MEVVELAGLEPTTQASEAVLCQLSYNSTQNPHFSFQTFYNQAYFIYFSR